METRTAVLAGASGLVGGLLLQRLLAHASYARVICVGRRALPIRHEKLTSLLTDFSSVDHGPWGAVHDAFCTLGTTIKQAGSQEAFRRVDHDAVLAFARAAQAAGATRFIHVSALGANARSRVFYNRVKGETEDDVAKLGFVLDAALRPSLLDGPRAESRPGERIGLAVARVFAPVLGKYGPTRADAVARVMIELALGSRSGHVVVEADAIR